MNLVLEVGNTNLKIAVFEGEELLIKRSYPVDSKLNSLEFDQYHITRAIKAGSGNTEIEYWNLLECEKYEFSKSQIEELNMAYKTPETLGEDRLLNAYAAIKKYPQRDILIIDCGTCITFTFVDSSPALIGGSISPGLQMRLKALHHYTHKLPLIELTKSDFQQFVGDDTISSILSGVILGSVYEIERRIDQYLRYYPNLSIIMTGGDMDLIENKIKTEIFVDSSLTLRGLNYTLNQL
jgi:type III pantothenate kinase